MKILFLCDEYPPGKHGGVGTMVQVLGRELVKQGHQVYVMGLYTYHYGEKDFEIDHGVEVHRIRYGMNFGKKSKNFFYKVLGKMPAWVRKNLNGKRAFQAYIDKINELVDEKKIDVIEIQDWNSFTFEIGFKVEWPNFKAPLIVKSNGSHTYFSDEANVATDAKFEEIDRALYARANALSAVSHYTESVNKRLFKYEKPVEILHNCIEVNFDFDINPIKQEKTFIFTGTLVKKKGIFSLMKAWNKVIIKHPDAILKIYGKGKIQPLKELLSPHAIERVQFLGHTTRQNLFVELSKATAAIFPSYSECFALAPLEALAVGCPVMNTSRASGKELIVDGENGSLIDPDNIDEIADKMIELIENKELQKKYAFNGQKSIQERFNIKQSAQNHIDYYKQIIKNK